MHTRAPSPLTLWLVFVSLIALLAVSAASSFFFTGTTGAVVALGLATVKATLIFVFFMRLRYQTGLVRLFALVGFLWLGLALTFALADYLTRR